MIESEGAKSDRVEAETPSVTIIPSAPLPDSEPSHPVEQPPNRLLQIIAAAVIVILTIHLISMAVARNHRPRPPINASPLLLDSEQDSMLPDN